MFGRNISRWARRAATLATAAVALAIVSGAAGAAPCKKVSGKFTLQAQSDPACPSPISLCATGSYKGDLKAESAFVGSSLITTADTPTTSVVLVTGDNRIETRDGTIFTKDAIVLRTTGAGDFAEVDTIVGGDGEWAGASGQISASGTFVAGSGQGVYSGEICTPQ